MGLLQLRQVPADDRDVSARVVRGEVARVPAQEHALAGAGGAAEQQLEDLAGQVRGPALLRLVVLR